MHVCFPIEIIQAILLYLDIETYAAARLTCRYWDYAASFPFMVWRMLQQTPVELPPITGILTMKEWNTYFAQFSRLNLLGYRTRTEKTHFQRQLPRECTTSAVLGASHDHRILVALQGPRVMVYDHAHMNICYEFSLALSLYPFWTSVCRALMESTSAGYISVNQRYAKHCISVSTCGNLVAVGLGKTIQIYGLSENLDSLKRPVEYKLGQPDTAFAFTPDPTYEETDGIVELLEFVDDDTLLRVAIGKETTRYRPTRVRYLGCPKHGQIKVDLAYWRANINQIYLDSVALGAILGTEAQTLSIFRGLQLLPPSYSTTPRQRESHLGAASRDTGRFFVAALQAGDTNAYCVGHVSHPGSCSLEYLQEQIVSLCRLFPSRYNQSGNSLPVKPLAESTPLNSNLHNHDHHASSTKDQIVFLSGLCKTLDRWSLINLPSATFSAPLLAVSDDGRILTIFEPGTGSYSSCFTEGGSLYVCSIENCNPIYQPGSSSYYSHLGDEGFTLPSPDIIPSWPFLLDTTSVTIESLRVVRCWDSKAQNVCGPDRVNSPSYKVTASSGAQVLEWILSDNQTKG